MGRTTSATLPCRGVPLPKVEQEEMRFLNPAEIAQLADKIRRAYRALVFVGAYGGSASGSWPRYVAPASTSPPASWTWPRRSTS
jgi:hypothetical protein